MTLPNARIETVLRHGIWRVTLDAQFYGDYRSRQDADEAMQALAVSLQARGRNADIVGKAKPHQ
jgi:hypothetical protein